MNNIPKNHHYVPEVQLKNFANEHKLVHIFNMKTKEFDEKFPKNILYEEFFHGYINEEGNMNVDFEKGLNKHVENPYGKALVSGLFAKIKSGKNPLKPKQLNALIDFVSVQYARTAKKKGIIESSLKQIVTELNAKDEMTTIYKTIGLQPFLETYTQAFVISNQSSNRRIYELAEKVIEMINKQNIAFLIAPEGKQFITSDDPAFIKENNNFIMALSADICMITGTEGSKYISGIITEEDVDHINNDAALNASEILVAKDQHILEGIVTRLALK